MFFDLDDLIELGKEALNTVAEASSELIEKAVDVVKEEAPHIAHKAGEIIEEVIKKGK